MASKTTFSKTRKRAKRTVTNGILHIRASFNNTLVSLTDATGDVLSGCMESGGTGGFKGTKKSTPFAAQTAVEKVATIACNEFGMKTLIIYVKGVGPGRDSAIRALSAFTVNKKLRVLWIKDKTGNPHGGPKPKKARRV